MAPDRDDTDASWGASFASATTDGIEVYEDVLVGPMFTPWAERLLDLLSVAPGEHLLDVATGPGTVARLAAARVGPAGRVVAIDLSPAMLSIATSKEAVDGGAPIDYRLGQAAPLDVPDAAFDVVCCQQGLQFFPERGLALAEMRRALRTGGRVGLAVWCDIERCPPFAALRDAVEAVLGADAAARYSQGPWGFHAPTALEEMVRAAGFTNVSVDEMALPVRFEGGAAQLDRTFAASGLAADVGALAPERRTALRDAVAERLVPMSDGTGAVTAELWSQVVVAGTS